MPRKFTGFVFIAVQLEKSIRNVTNASGAEAAPTISDGKLNRTEIQFISLISE